MRAVIAARNAETAAPPQKKTAPEQLIDRKGHYENIPQRNPSAATNKEKSSERR
jgi:hypothetical protein